PGSSEHPLGAGGQRLRVHDSGAGPGGERTAVRGDRLPGAARRLDRHPQLRGGARMIGSEPFVCLDLSLDRFSAVEVVDGRVARWTVQPLLSGSLRGGDPMEPKQLAAQFKTALARAGITARKARIAISDDAAVVRVVEVPRIPKRHMAGAIRYLSEQETPFPPGRASLAWDVIERRQNTIRVYIAAAWKDVVQRLVDTAKAAGLDPLVIEPRSLAVNREIGREHAIVIDASEMLASLTEVPPTETP